MATTLPASSERVRVICVLGMMRTGTSLVARLLEGLGVYFGPPESLLAANRANPEGFWEHSGIIGLNEELLLRLGGAWHSPPALAPGWEQDPKLDDLRERARELVSASFAGHPIWAWKDPRTCLTLPFWRSFLPRMTYVVCLRHPVDTAHSLANLPWVQRRVESPFETALSLWTVYTRAALEQTKDELRQVVFYEPLIQDSHSGIGELAALVGQGHPATDAGGIQVLASTVDPELWHQRSGDHENLESARSAVETYNAMLSDLRNPER